MNKNIYYLLILLLLCVLVGLFSKQWLGDDNVFEEKAEETLENYIGLKIDFSPEACN